MKKIIKYITILGLLNFNQFNALPNIPSNALILVKSGPSKLTNLTTKLKSSFQLPSLPKIDTKALDSKKMATIGAMSAIIDPTFALGAMYGIVQTALIAKAGTNALTKAKPEDKAIEIRNTQKTFSQNFIWAVQNPWQSINERCTLPIKITEKHPVNFDMTPEKKELLEKNKFKIIALALAHGISITGLSQAIGATVLDGYTCGVVSALGYGIIKYHSHLREQKPISSSTFQLNQKNKTLTTSNQEKK